MHALGDQTSRARDLAVLSYDLQADGIASHRLSAILDYSTAPSDIQRRCLLDLVQRARGGVAIHLLLWLLVGTLSGLVTRLPVFFWCVFGGFALSLACRVAFEPYIPGLSLEKPGLTRVLFLILILSNPAIWGLTSAGTVLWPSLFPASEWVWLIGIGVAASGGMSLAFDSVVRSLYAPLTVLPTVVAMLFTASGEMLFPPLAAVVFLIYIHRASRVVHGDYWSAVSSHVELAHRATLLERASATDALTQVSNRMHFDKQMIAEWARARRSATGAATATLVSVIMIDIDHFKKVNDSYGHPFGDLCLQAVAGALRSALVRPTDLLARFGGEEFIAMLPCTDAEGAAVVAARMHSAVAAISIEHEREAVKLTCSIGVHTVDSLDSSGASAVSSADQALYRAKRGGRNRVVVFAVAAQE